MAECSAGWPKLSAEYIRPIWPKISAEYSVSVVHYLTRYESTLNVPSKCGLTPLQFATKTGHSEIAEYLTKVEGLIDKEIESAPE